MAGRSHTYDLLSRGRAAAKAGDKAEAYRYLERLLNLYPPQDERMEALYWMSEVSSDPAEQRRCLEEILANNLGDARARRKLAILDGKLKPEEIIDPDRIPVPPPVDPQTPTRAFTCPKCGARMAYAADGLTLTCEYCEAREAIGAPSAAGGPDDFIVAMATAKAQRKPLQARSITCRGCGAGFLLPPTLLTHTCPYCATPCALEQVELRTLDAPDSILPFIINPERARLALREWFQHNPPALKPRVARATGCYLPVWLFNIGGQVDWSGEVVRQKQIVPVHGARIVAESDLLVPAGRRLSPVLEPVYEQFDLSVLQPFDLRYLADMAAETFSVSAADAALKARKLAQERLARAVQVEEMDQTVREFRLRTANLLVESYRLALLPVWLTSYSFDGDEERYEVLINGQTAEVLAEKPDSGLPRWFKNLLK